MLSEFQLDWRRRGISGCKSQQFVRAFTLAWFLAAVVSVASAQGDGQPVRQPARNRPPAMPAVLDRATVQGLIDKAEVDSNEIVLKFGYFMRRGAAQALPATDGLHLVKAAVEKEAPGSKRWLVLQSVRGFASFYAADNLREDGYAAYGEFFSRAVDADKVGADEVVQRTVLDFCAIIISRYGPKSGNVGPSAAILAKALEARLKFLASGKTDIHKIPWTGPIQEVNAAAALQALTDKVLADPATVRSFSLLRTAAEVFDSSLNVRAIELMKEAQPLVPPDDAQQVQEFYDSFFKLYRRLAKYPEAIALQRQRIEATGAGRANLIELLWERKDKPGLEKLLEELCAPTANEADIVLAASILIKFYERDVATTHLARVYAIKLLKSYLEANRPRGIESELFARLQLGKSLYFTGSGAEALLVLQGARKEERWSSVRAQSSFEAIQTFLSEIEKRNGR